MATVDQVKIDFSQIVSAIKATKERVRFERKGRSDNSQLPLSFGVSYLDDACGGIYKNDLILLGAKTGIGKTELATSIAMTNVLLGKRVHFFALEAEEFEIERRIKYRILSRVFHEILRERMPSVNFNYMDWYYGKLDAQVGEYEDEIDREIGEMLPTLFTFYRSYGDYTVNDFEKQFLGVQDQTDLVIIDHRHYFDHGDENELRALKGIVKKLRDTALSVGKPVVLVAQMRKSDRFNKSQLPTLEDFQGTSDIIKICTKAIIIAPDWTADFKNDSMQTLMHVAKNRVDSSVSRFIGVSSFSPSRREYTLNYYTAKFGFDQEKLEYISKNQDLPKWAKRSFLYNPVGGY